jgi:hypothetical protein
MFPVSEKLYFLGFRLPSDGQSPETSDAECSTPSLESFRFCSGHVRVLCSIYRCYLKQMMMSVGI